jgi:hypothetical protein
MDQLMLRYEGKNFYEIPDGEITRMEGFKTLSENATPEEYSRKYVDRKSQTNDVVGYTTVLDFELDRFVGNAVHDDIVDLHEKKVVGVAARRNIYYVDFTQPSGDGYKAFMVPCSVVMSNKGNTAEAMTYSGSFKEAGETVFGIAKIATPENGNCDTVQTITFEESAESDI